MLRSKIVSPLLLGASFLSLQFASATIASAGALPTGAHFVSGHGEISKATQSLTVRQSSTTGIINWNSFSIGADSRVNFRNGSGATLNRVTGVNISTIAGSLHATGSLYLINTQGLIVSGTGRVVTGGNFSASSGESADFSNDAERYAKNANAKVINHGIIVAGESVSLAGGRVADIGTVRAANVSIVASKGNALVEGNIRATGRASHEGRILVIAASGTTKITGRLVARDHGRAGGSIETSGSSVLINGKVDAGRGGKWLIDPENLTITSSAATTIENSLDGGTNVTLKTTANSASGPGTKSNGAGDIIVDAPITWSGHASLTLEAYNAIAIDQTIKLKNKGILNLNTDHGGGQELISFDGGNVDFATSEAELSVNGVLYTLITSMAALQDINDSSAARKGDYALAASLDAENTKDWKPIGTDGESDVRGKGFTGIFEGLGNSISSLSVKLGTNDYAGLFGYSSGAIRDIKMVGGVVIGGAAVGGLVGEAVGGTITGDSYAGTVTGLSRTGGLIGYNLAEIKSSSSSATVKADSVVGGLVGENLSDISDAYATGEVLGGKSDGSSIGGLVGTNDGLIEVSYATGSVRGSGQVGGLVGFNDGAGSTGEILNSYATGSVSAYSGTATDIGGLVGINDEGTISSTYSTGLVSGGTDAGGLLGDNQDGMISSSYWDKTTSHKSVAAGAGSSSGATAKNTAELQSKILKGFSKTVWAINPSINGGLPYLKALASSY